MTTTLPKTFYEPVMTIEIQLCMLVSKIPFTVRFQDENHAPIPCFAVCVKVTEMARLDKFVPPLICH